MTQLTDYDGTTLDYAYDAAGRVTPMNDYFSPCRLGLPRPNDNTSEDGLSVRGQTSQREIGDSPVSPIAASVPLSANDIADSFAWYYFCQGSKVPNFRAGEHDCRAAGPGNVQLAAYTYTPTGRVSTVQDAMGRQGTFHHASLFM